MTPKARRLHLIQGHGYPKEYYFAVTNKGVGGLLKRWGEGASLIRGQWKAREPTATPVPPDRPESVVVEEDDDDDDDDDEAASTPMNRPAQQLPPPSSQDEGVDSLAESLNALSLVPPSIRFGRGGKNGGFANDQQPRGGRGRDAQRHEDPMDVDVIHRGGRGRGVAHASDVNAEVVGNGYRGHGKAHSGASGNEDSDVLAYVPRGVRARGMPNVRGATSRGKTNAQRGGPDHTRG